MPAGRAQTWLWGIPVLLTLLGALLGGPNFWGINHLAYLSRDLILAWVLLAAILLVPPVRNRLGSQRGATTVAFLLNDFRGRLLLVVAAAAAFILLRSRTLFLGDGYLLTEIVDLGYKFRAFDNMDYLLHFQVFQLLRSVAQVTATQVYQWGAVAAGLLGVSLILVLVKRLEWDPWRAAVFLGLFLFSGPALMFFGYVESYGFLLVFLTCFLISGLAVVDGKLPLWQAATFFGLGLFFHLTAVFSAPALAYLAWRAPDISRSRRWLESILPVALLLLLAAGAHLVTGFTNQWFSREFLAGTHTQDLLTPLTGPWGLFSSYQFKLQFNLLLITCPVAVMIVLTRLPGIWSRRTDSRVQFLLVQILSVVFFSLVILRKLGDARDWDLLAAHFAALPLLAGLFLARPGSSGGKEAGLALGAALLVSLPWVVLNTQQTASVDRFTEVTAGFPPFARGYAYEGLGKYYREKGYDDQALDMYRLGAESCPGNPRFHKLLGSSYLEAAELEERNSPERNAWLEKAAESYALSLNGNPDQDIVRENLGRILIQTGNFASASQQYLELTERKPQQASAWASLGFCQLQLAADAEAVASLNRALQLDPRLKVRRYLASALLNLGEVQAAHDACRLAVQNGEPGATQLQARIAARLRKN